jgi:hypothetical protein
MSLAISTTKSDKTVRAFATLRFAGDALDPNEISRVVKEQPTKAYRKGETYRSAHTAPMLLVEPEFGISAREKKSRAKILPTI